MSDSDRIAGPPHNKLHATILSYNHKLHFEQAVAAISDVWSTSNPVARALSVGPDEYLPRAKEICENARHEGAHGPLSLIATDAHDSVMGFYMAYPCLPRESPDTEFERAMSLRTSKMRAWGIYLRAAELLSRAQVSAVLPALGIIRHPDYVYLDVSGVREHEKSTGVFNAMSKTFWAKGVKCVADGGPPIVTLFTTTHPKINHFLSTIAPTSCELGGPREFPIAPSVVGEAANAASCAATIACKRAVVEAAHDPASLARWSIIDFPVAGALFPIVRVYLLRVPLDMRELFGSLHSGFQEWPNAPECRPLACSTITVPLLTASADSPKI